MCARARAIVSFSRSCGSHRKRPNVTDRINALVVLIDEHLAEEDAWPLVNAIAQLRGVVGVDPHWAAPDGLIAQMRLDNVVELRRR